MEDEDSYSACANHKALQIPCILQQIFMYLPHTDLKRTRLVNRVFNEESSRILRKRSKIVLNSPKRLISFYLERFTDVHSFCEGFQLVNVHVATPSMQIFLESCSHSIKSLDLRDSKWTYLELKDILLRASSQLEELIIHGQLPKELWSSNGIVPLSAPTDSHSHPEPSRPHAHNFWGLSSRACLPDQNGDKQGNEKPPELAQRFVDLDDDEKRKVVLWLPKVKRVDLQLYDKLPEDEFLRDFVSKILVSTRNLEILRSSENQKGKSRRERFHRVLFETLIDPKYSVTLPKLTKIDFSLTPWGEDQYQKLSLKQFPLTYLSLTILPDISTYTVIKLLMSLKRTLSKLKISFTNWQIMEFPCDLGLERLRHLSLDWYNGSLKFVPHLTNLETLILAQVDLNEALRDEFEYFIDEADYIFHDKTDVRKIVEQTRHRRLQSFELYQPSGAEILPDSIRKLSGIFPNLTKLVLGKLSDTSLRAVVTAFPGLEEFSAIEGSYTDEGVTGIAVRPCHICDKTHLTELCRGMYNERLINAQRRHCYIGDLKNLRRLELRAPSLTNLSIYHGILQCKRLRSLTLRSFHLTYGSLRRLVDTFNLDYLESTHTFSHAAEIKYALKSMNGRVLILNGMEAPRDYCRCSSREIDHFIGQFKSFIVNRPIVDIPKHNTRKSKHSLQHFLDSLTHRKSKR